MHRQYAKALRFTATSTDSNVHRMFSTIKAPPISHSHLAGPDKDGSLAAKQWASCCAGI